MPDKRSIYQIVNDWLRSPLGGRSMEDSTAELVRLLEQRERGFMALAALSVAARECQCPATLRELARDGGSMLFTREAALELAASLIENRRRT